jgi:hypothetical protein
MRPTNWPRHPTVGIARIRAIRPVRDIKDRTVADRVRVRLLAALVALSAADD